MAEKEVENFVEQLEDDSENDLDILFPDYDLELGTGETITIKPVSMLHTNKIIRSLRRLITKYRELSGQGKSSEEIIQEILSDCLDELLFIAPLCVFSKSNKDSGEAVLDRVGPKDTPRVVDIIIRQNFHPDVLGNWTTLVTGIKDLIPAEMMQGMVEDAG